MGPGIAGRVARHAARHAAQMATQGELAAARGELIASVSGYRAIFARDRHAESTDPTVPAAFLELVALISDCFVDWLQERLAADGHTLQNSVIVIGRDTRPTGAAIMEQSARLLWARGLQVRWVGVCATPELMALVRATDEAVAFICVTASHNPRGYNGLKLGLGDGTLLDRSAAAELLARFDAAWCSDKRRALLAHRLGGAAPTGRRIGRRIGRRVGRRAGRQTGRWRHVRRGQAGWKRAALQAYRRLCMQVIGGTDEARPGTAPSGTARPGTAPTGRDSMVLRQLAGAIRARRCLIVADFNGGARAVSIDVAMLTRVGAVVRKLHGRPGAIAHAMLPEGDALNDCAALLCRLRRPVAFGYVCDNDGDRGNLVYYDPLMQQARSLSAQEGFALICMIELAWLALTKRLHERVALVVNGPTSGRVDYIAARFGATVFRAEVGEANLIGLAARLRSEGWLCPLAGEGSNGGVIIHPSGVRDPLLAVFAMLRMLYARGADGRTLLQIWQAYSAGASAPASAAPAPTAPAATATPDDAAPTIAAAIAALPPFVTTPVGDAQAALHLSARAHGDIFGLKCAYEELFRRAWQEDAQLRKLRQRLGLQSWQVHHYCGTRELVGTSADLPPNCRLGGMKIVLQGAAGRAVASLWMRGSGTEPIFRALVDVEGARAEDERRLLRLHGALIRAADNSL